MGRAKSKTNLLSPIVFHSKTVVGGKEEKEQGGYGLWCVGGGGGINIECGNYHSWLAVVTNGGHDKTEGLKMEWQGDVI